MGVTLSAAIATEEGAPDDEFGERIRNTARAACRGASRRFRRGARDAEHAVPRGGRLLAVPHCLSWKAL